MSKRISKEKAIELITPVVDDEIDQEMRIAFFEYIEHDDDVRIQYESAKRIKKLVSTRYKCAKAPKKLRKRVSDYLETAHHIDIPSGKREDSSSLVDQPVSTTPKQSGKSSTGSEGSDRPTKSQTWIQAAAILLIVLSGILMYSPQQPASELDEFIYSHFEGLRGELMEPVLATSSLAEAEIELAHNYDMAMTVPPVENSEFVGIAYVDLVPGFKTPILEYRIPEQNENIYIYAFNIQQLSSFDKLVRNSEAVEACKEPTDFHIRRVNGKDLVHWKWNGTWYTAISNHKGSKLASFITPLHREDRTGE